MSGVDYEAYHEGGRTERFGDVFERVRARTIESLLRNRHVASPATLLDAGAGEGRYLDLWQRLFPGARVIALEVSETASARSAARHPDVEHVVASAEAIPLPDASVDGIVSVEVIEHVPSGTAMLRECARVLRPGGFFVLSTPCGNRGSLEWWRARMTGNLEPGSEHGIRFGGYEDATHLRRYRSGELAALCESLGLTVEHVSFNGHGFLWLGEVLEVKVKGKVNIGRRSPRMEQAFEGACDFVGLLDWRVLRRLPFGSTQMLVLRKARR